MPGSPNHKRTHMSYTPTIALDFDGVIHDYHGWNDGKMGDPIVGAGPAIEQLISRGAEVVIFSTRDVSTIVDWWNKWEMPEPIHITREKPPWLVLLDDRAICFNGKWTETLVDDLINFKTHWETEERVL